MCCDQLCVLYCNMCCLFYFDLPLLYTVLSTAGKLLSLQSIKSSVCCSKLCAKCKIAYSVSYFFFYLPTVNLKSFNIFEWFEATIIRSYISLFMGNSVKTIVQDAFPQIPTWLVSYPVRLMLYVRDDVAYSGHSDCCRIVCSVALHYEWNKTANLPTVPQLYSKLQFDK